MEARHPHPTLSLTEGEGTEVSALALNSSPPKGEREQRSAILEHALAVELHQGLRTRAEGGAAPWHGGGLDRLEQLTLGRPVVDGPSHVREHAFLPAAVGEDADDDHLAVLDGELLALADGERRERLPRLDVLGILLGNPVPEGIAVGACCLAVELLGPRAAVLCHGGLLEWLDDG